jgi:hypothetical protein
VRAALIRGDAVVCRCSFCILFTRVAHRDAKFARRQHKIGRALRVRRQPSQVWAAERPLTEDMSFTTYALKLRVHTETWLTRRVWCAQQRCVLLISMPEDADLRPVGHGK